jgi:hypothetical protein
MRPFTLWGGVDSPSKGAISPCLGFWFLNPSACQVCLHCIVYHVISYSCLAFCLGNYLFYPLYVLLLSWEISASTIWGWQKKHIRLLLFYLGISTEVKFVLTIHARRCLCIYFHLACSCCFSVFFFNIKKKKKKREKMRNFYFSFLIAFQILNIFLPDTSVHCALIEYAYIWLRVYDWYLLSFLVHLNAR